MKIKELKLFTNQLEKQKEFFLKVLGFELLDEKENEFCLKIGWSKLRFVKSDKIHIYHYCFLIPSNKLIESLEWMNNRMKTIDVENGEKIVHFEDWNADSFYFYDGGGNIAEFIKIVESEALTLHAMMMTSMPYFILMKPNTLEIINKIWKFRNETQIPVCFTLDAGANVHVLYPENVSEKALQFIKDELVGYCQNGQYICDEIGFGAIETVN
jgi:catechol 2,3-dioxygenase-like lactoylglutathione lyase family enzyme